MAMDNKKIRIKGDYSIENTPHGDYNFIWEWLTTVITDRMYAVSPLIVVTKLDIGIEYEIIESKVTVDMFLTVPDDIKVKHIMHSLEDLYTYTDFTKARLGHAVAFLLNDTPEEE